jgi:tetratricopeptide (TPR) repeat protein
MSDQYKSQWANDAEMKDIDSAYEEFRIGGFKDFKKALKKTTDVLTRLKEPMKKEKEAHVYVHLGAIYYKNGEFKKARDMFNKAKEINPNDADIQPNINKMDKEGV